jgi:nitroreductase
MFCRFLSFVCVVSFVFFQETISNEPDNCHSMDTCFEDILQIRHSGYNFDITKPINPKLFVPLAQATRLSPSSYNEQPWRFIFCDLTTTPEAYLKALNTLQGGNELWASQAPLLVIVASKSLFTKNQKPNLWNKFDTGAAVMSFVYKAASLGLMTHEIGGFDASLIRKDFAIPDEYQPVVIIAVGYEHIEEGESIEEKERLPLGENFFLGDWNIPLD